MPRAIWTGTISFGMVGIPVEIFPAIAEKDIHFHQIHVKCGSRIKQQKWCPVDECVVPNDEIAKGYEISKGKYVLITDSDLESLPVPSKHVIEVVAFVSQHEVDPIYYEATYYITPETAGRKAFSLLREALEHKGVSALAKISLRQKESLCLLRQTGDSILLNTLYYHDEIRTPLESTTKDVKVDAKEVKMAESLVDLLSEPFEPEKYRDEYREALVDLIEAKSNGKDVETQPEQHDEKVIDLMEALRASLDQAQNKKKKKAG
jgi:DNA end-binding protein Ku